MKKILIGFAGALACPESVWSLVKGGYKVYTFAREGEAPAVRKSRMTEVYYIPAPETNVAGARTGLLELIEKLDVDLVMPLDDVSLWLCDTLRKKIRVPLVAPDRLGTETALNKELQVRRALEAGFDVPETGLIRRSSDMEQIRHFPVILKSAFAAREEGNSIRKGGTYIFRTREEIQDFAVNWQIEDPLLAQAFVRGTGCGVFGIAREGKVLAWSGHKRLRMMNPHGSGSSACISMIPDEKIKAVCGRFIGSLNWNGIFMIELLEGEDGRLWFMEINGRAWGSMALARGMGYEYPLWGVENVVRKDFFPELPEPLSEPLVARNLGREIVHLLMVMRGPKFKAIIPWPRRFKTFIDLCRGSRNQIWYNYEKRDRKVFFADTAATIKSQVFKRRKG